MKQSMPLQRLTKRLNWKLAKMHKMKTVLISAQDETAIEQGAELIRAGELVVFPTETVYGLGANALDSQAVEKIFEAKGRPQDNPLIVHIASFDEIYPLVREISPVAKRLADAFWPGPLTMIFPKSDLVPSVVSGNLGTVAIRVPSHPVARALIAAAGVPIAAPSANRSGSPSPTTSWHSYQDLEGRVPLIIDGGTTWEGIESTVVTFRQGIPVILRPGSTTPEDIKKVVGEVIIDQAVLGRLEEHREISSPGLKYKHYAPNAQVVLVRGTAKQFADYCNSGACSGLWAMAFSEDIPLLDIPSISYGKHDDVREQGRELFSALRLLDEKGAEKIYVHAPNSEGIGLAVYNRLLRASSFQEVDLSSNQSEKTVSSELETIHPKK